MSSIRSDLQSIPGVGPRIADYLGSIGIQNIADLKARDPEELYRQLCRKHSQSFDRCLLYVFRCATYYASVPEREPHLLKWWNWKDRPGRRSGGLGSRQIPT